jgi:hypothetical protein
MNTLNDNDRSRISVWMNNIKNLKCTAGGVLQQHEKVYQFIVDKYTNKNTIKAQIVTLSKVVGIKNNEIADEYKQIYSELGRQIIDDLKSQTPSSKFIDFEIIEAKRDELLREFKKHPGDTKLNMQSLILSLYTLQPPIRLEYTDMKIIKRAPVDKEHGNYMWIKPNNEYWIIINDKVKNRYGTGELKLENDRLVRVIDQSLTFYPRSYVLSLLTKPNEPLKDQNFWRIVSEIFGKNIGVDTFRQAYVSNFYNNRPTNKQKKKLAIKMRHSEYSAGQTYDKIKTPKNDSSDESDDDIKSNSDDDVRSDNGNITSDSDDDTKSNTDDVKNEDNSDNDTENKSDNELFVETELSESKQSAEDKLNKMRSDARKRSIKHYNNNKYDVLRRKMLKTLNIYKTTGKPNKASIRKYKLKYDKKKKIWY